MGTLSKSAGSFQIDDPVDPANKYLYHSFVESPDMMNIYNGNVTLGPDGTAWVTIPGELQAALGLEIKREARALFRHAYVAGVSNDYLGYFVTAEDYSRPAYVTCATVYGPRAGECLATTAAELLRGLAGQSRPATTGARACDGASDR